MKKVFAFILSVIFIILLPVNLVAYNIKTNVFNPDFYTKTLAKYNTYEKVLDEATTKLFESEESKKMLEEVPFISVDDLKGLLKELVTPLWLQQQVENVINQFFKWFESEQDIRNVEIKINLADLKSRITDILKTKIDEKIKSFKTCSAKELKNFNEQNLKDITCLPADFTAEIFLQQININESLKQVPDEVDLIKLIKGEITFGNEPAKDIKNKEEVERTFNTINRVRDLIKTAFTAVNYLFVVLGLIFLLIASLTMKKLRSMLRWLGFNLFLPGIFLFAGAIALHSILTDRINILITGSKLSTELSQILKNIVIDLISQILTNLRIEGIILFIVGIVLITLSYIIKLGKSGALSSVNK